MKKIKKANYSKNIIQELSIKHNTSINETKKAYQYLIKIIIKSLMNNSSIQITGFGKFFKSKRNQKETTHPITKKRYIIPKRQTIQCKFSKLLNKINKSKKYFLS